MVLIIGSQTSSMWVWLGPVLTFCGSLLLFGGSMIVLWRTNLAADRRHDQQLDTTRNEGIADRVAQRNDRFREEVASLIGEKHDTVKVAYELSDAVAKFFADRENTDVPPREAFWKARAVRDKHTPQLNKVEHLAIRASLLTNDQQVSSVLEEIRIVSQLWKELFGSDPYDRYIEIHDRLEAAFSQLETLTRRLVTSDGAPSLTADQAG